MNTELLIPMLGWSALINYLILIIWFVMFGLAHDFIYNLHSRFFNLRLETFDALHYAGMAVYKLAILLFNLVPWLILLILY